MVKLDQLDMPSFTVATWRKAHSPATVAAPIATAPTTSALCQLSIWRLPPTAPIEPAAPMDAIEPAEPIEAIEPAHPIEAIEPVDPIDKMEPVE